MNQIKRNHLICNLLVRNPHMTAREAQRRVDEVLWGNKYKKRKKKKKDKPPRKDRLHHRGAKKKARKEYATAFYIVLENAGFSNYGEYLQSPHWKQFRREVLNRRGCCYACNTVKDLNIHHIDYDRLGHEAETDVVVLCERCHDTCHRRLDFKYPGLTLVDKVRHSHEVMNVAHPGSTQLKKQKHQDKPKPKFFHSSTTPIRPAISHVAKSPGTSPLRAYVNT